MFSIQNLKVCTNQHRNRKQIKIRKEISMTIEIKYNVGDKIVTLSDDEIDKCSSMK